MYHYGLAYAIMVSIQKIFRVKMYIRQRFLLLDDVYSSVRDTQIKKKI